MSLRSSLRCLVLVSTTLACAACSKKSPEPQKAAPVATAPAKPTKVETAPGGGQGGDGKLDPNDPKHGALKLMGLDVGVFVDGSQVGVLRYGDLPVIPKIVLEGGAERFKLGDYLAAIGVDVANIKSVHLHGNGDRIASVEGKELRKEQDRFLVQFLGGKTGTPIVTWDTDGLKNEFVVHEIRKMTVYVKKPSAPIDAQKNCHVGPDGDCTDAVPYSDGVAVKGTRVYVDGKMVGFVKRRQITDDLAMGDTPDGDHKFSVAKLVAKFGVDPTTANAIELVAGDDVVGRATGDQMSQVASGLYFTLPKHEHGKVRVHVLGALQANEGAVQDRDAFVSSVIVYKTTRPAERPLVAISEDTDLSVQLASNTARELGREQQ